MEIGSEFSWPVGLAEDHPGKLTWLPETDDCQLVFSGRTAIEEVIRDAGHIRKILLPSYCCDSMVEPFRKRGIQMESYPVDFCDGLKVDFYIPEDCDAVLWCNYFGYRVSYPTDQIETFRQTGGIVIEDITHSLLSREQFHASSDYLVASLRKWGPLLSGGMCCKLHGKFLRRLEQVPNINFIEAKRAAMRLKSQYLSDMDPAKKSGYLDLFSQSNRWLAENYSGLLIDAISESLLAGWDVLKIRQMRRKNASMLMEMLGEIDSIKLLFPFEQMDCPLFVPLVVENGKRDRLHQKLVENDVYCPIHWPAPRLNCDSNLYQMELSLVCDQRYTQQDMLRMVNILRG